MKRQQVVGWTLTTLVALSGVLPALAYPSLQQAQIEYQQQQQQHHQYQQQYHQQHQQQPEQGRKFAEKPNATKKVAHLENRNDFDDIATNQIPFVQDGGFSWSNMLGMIMQLLFPTPHQGPNKSDSLDTDQGLAPSPWAQLITVGLKIITALLGGGGVGGDGIDKVDNSSPMQGVLAAILSALLGSRDPDQVATMAKQAGEFINIVVNLLDALKTSFSHRSLAARSLGRKDSVSEAAVASVTLLKGYMRTMKTTDESCMLRYLCEANKECTGDSSASNSIYCQLGSYAASYMLQRGGLTPFEAFYEAGRRGRSGEDCSQVYLACNQV